MTQTIEASLEQARKCTECGKMRTGKPCCCGTLFWCHQCIEDLAIPESAEDDGECP